MPCPERPGSQINLAESPPFRLQGTQQHAYTVVPLFCPKCHADGHWLLLEGYRLSHPGSVGGCGWAGYLVRGDMPRPVTGDGRKAGRIGQKARADV